jgi:hypothetical protein
VGEHITTSASDARGLIVTSDSGATGTITYVLLTATNFADTNVVVGDISAKSSTLDAAGGATVVAGYNDAARAMVVSSRMTGGTTAVATPIIGEEVSQGANVGYLVHEEPANTLFIEEHSGTWDGTTLITGDTSGFTYTPTTRTLDVDFEYDIGDGLGTDTYSGMVSGNRLGATAKTATEVYEWMKWITASTATTTIFDFKTRGTANGATVTPGNIFTQLFAAAGLLKSAGNPTSQKPGAVIIGAVGWVFEKGTLDTADVRNVQLFANDGTQHDAPNLQAIQITGNTSGDAGIVRVQAGGSRTVSPLPADVPDSGVIYPEDPNNPGIYLAMPYSSVDRTNNDFTLTSGTIGDVTGATDLVQTDDLHVSFFRETATGGTISNTVQFVSSFPVVFVHRIKGIKPQRTAADFTATGASVGAARDPDPVVNLP